jgi:hypothetical protein
MISRSGPARSSAVASSRGCRPTVERTTEIPTPRATSSSARSRRSGAEVSGVVLSTLRQAADLDFGLTVPADGCLDADPEVHRVLTEKVFPMQAGITTLADWAAKL